MRFFITCVLFSFAFASAYEVVGANSSLEAAQGARAAGIGGAALALDFDLPSLAHNPLLISEVENTSIAFMHVSYFEGTSYNGVVMALPLGDAGTLGFAASRFGASDIPRIRENEPLPEGESYSTFSISDWILTSAWARSFGKWGVALSMHLLKRELDQSGWGFRSDVAAGYAFSKNFAAAGIVKGWTSSSVQWESGYFEYSNPEVYAAFRFSKPVPYFYGKLNAYWQSASIFDDASNLFFDSGAGLEFETDFKFSLRAGLFQISDTESLALGAGIKPRSWLSADYAFQMHQALSSVHRISLTAGF